VKKNEFKIILIIVLLSSFNLKLLNAQAFKEGDNVFSVGYGFVVMDVRNDAIIVSDLDNNSSKLSPIYIKYEYALSAYLSIGINFAYIHYQDTYTVCGDCPVPLTPPPPPNSVPYYYQETDTYLTWSALARLNWHFEKSKKFDPYCGVGLGFKYGSWHYLASDPLDERNSTYSYSNPIGMEITIGTRYYFFNHIGAYIETGFAKSLVQTGLTAKF
jgi:hypothetical protein